jgi:hypothetical protein
VVGILRFTAFPRVAKDLINLGSPAAPTLLVSEMTVDGV